MLYEQMIEISENVGSFGGPVISSTKGQNETALPPSLATIFFGVLYGRAKGRSLDEVFDDLLVRLANADSAAVEWPTN